jgi:hypothetical protein
MEVTIILDRQSYVEFVLEVEKAGTCYHGFLDTQWCETDHPNQNPFLKIVLLILL